MMRPMPGSLKSVSGVVVFMMIVAVGAIGCRDERADRSLASGSAVQSSPAAGVPRAAPPRPLVKVDRDDGSGDFELLELMAGDLRVAAWDNTFSPNRLSGLHSLVLSLIHI